MKRVIFGLGVLALLCLTSTRATAHTISIGTFNAGSPGSVTLAMGTYSHGGPIFEGAMTLTSGPGIGAPVLQNFTTVVTTKPAGLIDGTTNFYADAVPATWGTLPSNSFNSPTDTTGIGPAVNWQLTTFTGLSAGTYNYTLSGMFSQNWTNLNSFANNWSGSFTVTGAVAGRNVPEPISIAVFGGLVAVGGLAARRRVRVVA